MKKFFLLFLFWTTLICFGQKEEPFHYHFDTFLSFKTIHYNKFEEAEYDIILVKNSYDKNSYISINNTLKSATLFDYSNNKIFFFNFTKNIESIDDLKHLDTISHYVDDDFNELKKFASDYKKKYKEVEFERDSIKHSLIVHKIVYSNKKKKKIIDEQYYVFKENKNKTKKDENEYESELIINYKVPLITTDEIDKIIYVENGKKISESNYNFIKKQNIEFNFISYKK
ncbi:hypothetical protein [Flavobacterium aciduliphilum]|uniref:Uncharacterized protein n=1 Tax=Flavobacterium aciduliphilum TaxID=1101402 RepID=A0A328Y840_9FLAO|nr:hypothetical protein [Flavobacterium aciduliphilum]RAR70198.1 hypothetical protein CLV55_11122 [Flavobacterium aciduliphilum]